MVRAIARHERIGSTASAAANGRKPSIGISAIATQARQVHVTKGLSTDILSRHSDQEPMGRHRLSSRHALQRAEASVLYMIEFGGNNDASVIASTPRTGINWPLICASTKTPAFPPPDRGARPRNYGASGEMSRKGTGTQIEGATREPRSAPSTRRGKD
jgi:hypothetical protein